MPFTFSLTKSCPTFGVPPVRCNPRPGPPSPHTHGSPHRLFLRDVTSAFLDLLSIAPAALFCAVAPDLGPLSSHLAMASWAVAMLVTVGLVLFYRASM